MAKKVQKKVIKKTTLKKTTKKTAIKKKSKVKKMMDDALTQFSPELKAKVSNLKKKLNSKKMQNVADLRKLALVVLDKAEKVVSVIRAEKQKLQKSNQGKK